MMANAGGAESVTAVAGWGVGLTLVGLFFAAGGIGYITDYKGLATGHVRSAAEARREIPFLVSRADTPNRVRQARCAFGSGLLFVAFVFIAIGIFEFTLL